MSLKLLGLSSIAAAVIVLAGATTAGRSPDLSTDDQRALADFNRHVSEYVELHRRLEGPEPTIQVSSDPGEIRRAMAALARKIRAERNRAREADFFTSAAGPVLRRLIAVGCGGDLEGLHALATEESPYLKTWRPRVNEPYPDKLPFSMVPWSVLCSLPELPEELQFRFWDRALILWDYHANLIVDVLPNAIPST
jgi:hypothetical protein